MMIPDTYVKVLEVVPLDLSFLIFNYTFYNSSYKMQNSTANCSDTFCDKIRKKYFFNINKYENRWSTIQYLGLATSFGFKSFGIKPN